MANVGLNWCKCDFHLHTMSSKCYKEKTDTVQSWVEEVKKKNLDCIAVTDHNDYRGIDEIKRECEKEGIVVFPGVELSCDTSKIHMLVLFDPNCSSIDVSEFLTQLDITKEKLGDSKITCSGTIFSACKKAHEKGALIIAAHIDEYNGLGEISYDNIEKILDRKYINAIQVVNEDVWKIYEQENNIEEICNILSQKYGKAISKDKVKEWHNAYSLAKKSGLPLLKFSDNPCSEESSEHGLWGIGRDYTWLKMKQKPDLESVRQALLSYDMRVKIKDNPVYSPSMWIKSVGIYNSLLNEDQPICIEFNPQLNTIIGGRGSGKSSVIRTIAGVLKTFDESDLENILQEQNDFYKTREKKKPSGIFKSDSTVELIIERNDELYKIEVSKIKSMDMQERVLYCFNADTDKWEMVEDVNYFDFFSAQVFTQKQIYEMARDANSILNIIDEDIEDLSGLIEKREQNLNIVISKQLELWNVEKQIEEESRIKTELSDLDNQIEKYNKSGISEALKGKQKYDDQRQVIDRFFSNINIQFDTFDEKLSTFFNEISELPKIDDTELEQFFTEYSEVVASTKSSMDKLIESLINCKQETLSKINTSQWNGNYKKSIEQYKSVCDSLENQGVPIGKLDELLTDKEKKLLELNKIEEYKKNKTNLQTELEKVKKQYEKTVQDISKRRSEFISGIIGTDPTVKFEIKRARNKDSFVKMMINLLGKENATINENIMELQDVFFGKNGKMKFTEIIKKIRSKEDVSSYSKRMRDAIIEMQPESYARMIAFIADDDLAVSYRPEKSKKYIPLSNASAGQKTTAILTFLLAYGQVPLLLDQPEDDLDNRLVYDLIVTKLKETKEKRQIIVVTHNANIPVNGDAEYIIAMDSETDKIRTKMDGTMDDAAISKEICDVMEGTKYAFEMRAKKYHFNIEE